MTERWLGRYQAPIFVALRIIAGLLLFFHGMQKLFGWPGAKPPVALASLMGVAGAIELVCGALVTIGLLGGLAAFIASGLLAVAYFMSHAKGGFLPIVNKGELAVILCFVFLYIAAHGSGPASVDAALRGNGKR
ncbi:MAG: DoxX family protein [Thermoanaerobaculia bacterium]